MEPGRRDLRPDADHQDPGPPQEPVADRGGDHHHQGKVRFIIYAGGITPQSYIWSGE
jgi:hypothetical protein